MRPRRPLRATDSEPSCADAASGDRLDMGGLDELVGYRLRRAYMLSNAAFADAIADLGIAPGQFSILKIAALNPGRSQKAIAAAAGVDQSTLVPILTHLEKSGWISRAREADRRVMSVTLTEAGRELLAAAEERALRHERGLTASLSVSERFQLLALLHRLTERRDSPPS